MIDFLERLRQALDDAMLTHTGRSIGDLASQRVAEEIKQIVDAELSGWQFENATLRAENERLLKLNAQLARYRPIVEAVAAIKEGGDGWNDKRPYDAQINLLIITQARAALKRDPE